MLIYDDKPVNQLTTSRDSMVFAFTNSITSFLAGFVIFSVLGFMSLKRGVSVKDVAESGMLTLVVYWTLKRA